MSRHDARSTPFVIPFPSSPPPAQPAPAPAPAPPAPQPTSLAVGQPPPTHTQPQPPMPLPIPVPSLPSLSAAATRTDAFAADFSPAYNAPPATATYQFDYIAPPMTASTPTPVIPPVSATGIASPVTRSYASKREYADHAAHNGHTFSGLTHGIMSHPFFALLFKKVFQVCGSTAFDTGQLSGYFADAESRAKGLKSYAETQGLDGACEKWTSTDVFMSALIAAFASLQSSMASGAPTKNHTLHHTIVVAERALSSGAQYTDPRFVGATRDRFPYHSSPLRGDRMISKPIHGAATRTPLTEKAKAALERWFQDNLENPYPTVAQKMELARICSMTLSSVNNWFGNKRMRIKRKMLNVNTSDANGFGADGPSISNKVLAPRSKWNAVVVSKMNSQAGREVVASATGRANIYADDHDAMGVLRADGSAHNLGMHDARSMNPPS